MRINVRTATVEDSDVIVDLLKQQACFEGKKPEEITVDRNRIKLFGFGEQPYFHVLLAEQDHKVVGLALYFFSYSSYIGEPVIYLEELFVVEQHRSKGVGEVLMRELAGIAEQKSCCRIQWLTFDWNEKAISFYKKLGAEFKSDLKSMRWPANKFNKAPSKS